MVHSAVLTLMDTGEAVICTRAPGELLLQYWLKMPGVLWGGHHCAEADTHRGAPPSWDGLPMSCPATG